MSTNFQARSGQNQQQQSRRLFYKALVRDLITVGAVGIVLLCVHELAMPFIRGFNCNDETIRYPYKDSTVSSGVCYAIGSGVNMLLILLVEYLNLTKNQDRQEATNSVQDVENGGFRSITYAKNVYCRLLIWFFGAMTSELLTDISKVTAGRLRPHFIDVCQPLIQGHIPLDDFCKTHPPYEYIQDYVCSGNPQKQRDARLSFLSGHSSYSAYSATFAIFYIQRSLDSNKSGLLKPSLQVLIAALAFYTGLTRVSDYKHHWQDVLAGLLLGTLIASFVSRCVWPSFYKNYSSYLNKKSTNKQSDVNEEMAAELNRLGY